MCVRGPGSPQLPGMDEENIHVVIRVRPLRSHERDRGETTCVKIRDRIGTAGGPGAAAVSQEVRKRVAMKRDDRAYI